MSLFNKTYEIKILNGKVLFKSNKVKSLKECVELAVKEKVDISGANFEGADLSGVNFNKANLSGVNFNGANLKGANLEKTNLEGVFCYRTNFKGANLKEANLERANINEANFEEANLENACLVQSFPIDVNFDNAKLASADFTGAMFSSDEIKEECIRRSKKGLDAEMIKNAQNLIRAASMQNGK